SIESLLALNSDPYMTNIPPPPWPTDADAFKKGTQGSWLDNATIERQWAYRQGEEAVQKASAQEAAALSFLSDNRKASYGGSGGGKTWIAAVVVIGGLAAAALFSKPSDQGTGTTVTPSYYHSNGSAKYFPTHQISGTDFGLVQPAEKILVKARRSNSCQI